MCYSALYYQTTTNWSFLPIVCVLGQRQCLILCIYRKPSMLCLLLEKKESKFSSWPKGYRTRWKTQEQRTHRHLWEIKHSQRVRSGWGFLPLSRWHEAELPSSPFVSSLRNHTASCTEETSVNHLERKEPVTTPSVKLTQNEQSQPDTETFHVSTVTLTRIKLILLRHLSPLWRIPVQQLYKPKVKWIQALRAPVAGCRWCHILWTACSKVSSQEGHFPCYNPELKHLTEELMIFDSLARCTHTILVESTDTVIRNRSKEDDQWWGDWADTQAFSSCWYHWFMTSVPRNWAETLPHIPWGCYLEEVSEVPHCHRDRSQLPRCHSHHNHSNNSFVLSGTCQLLGESFKRKDATGVFHLQAAFKGMRRGLHFTGLSSSQQKVLWLLLFTVWPELFPAEISSQVYTITEARSDLPII